jgi:sec-independent protein translocase protein TatB
VSLAGSLGFIQNFSGGEMIVILIVALVVLGPERLPEMARSAGKMLHKVRGMTEGLQSEVKDVMDDPSMQPIKELGELAARPRQKLTEYALEAEAEERARKEAERAAAAAAAVAEISAAAEQQASHDEDVTAPDEAARSDVTAPDEAARSDEDEPAPEHGTTLDATRDAEATGHSDPDRGSSEPHRGDG